MSNSVLVIAEKPSVARDIAAVIGADESTDGALRGNGYIVTSARGHLVRLKEPLEYDERYNKWDLSDLPIIPDFEFVPIENAADVLGHLTVLMNSAEVDEIICATDAGREGECIFRYIYDYIGCIKPVKRLWISSLTAESIRNGFANLRSAADYDKMYAAGITRAKIDWLWGMNLTRLYTKHLGAICSIGRVQTAVVNMIASRDNEIDHFTKKPYFKLKMITTAGMLCSSHQERGTDAAQTSANGVLEWFDDSGDCFTTYAEAQKVKSKCENGTCKVVSVKANRKKENRPLLFSLTSLQVEANDKMGFSAATTLTVMQSLYEKKFLTYPRTDSNFLTEDMAAILADRVKLLRVFDERADDILSEGLNIDSRIINNDKVSDHHAIIPTENIASAANAELSANENAILDMVITRFLAALSAQYEYTETEYVFTVNGERFKSKTKSPINLGWKKFYIDGEVNEPEIVFSEGDTFTAKNIEIAECETQPPKRFTESTLLKAMENIDRRIEDKELSEYVSERGLGTPATRAAIIERVIKVGYVERKGKAEAAPSQLVSTDKGKKIIALLPDEVKSVEMTAAMELQLAAIENGTISADEVVSGMNEKIRSIIALENGKKHTSLAPTREPLGKCPKCGGNVFKFTKDGKTVFYCENSPKACFFRIYEDDYFFTSKGKKLTESIMKTLLTRGKAKINGFKSEKTGKTYDATISFKDRTDKNGDSRVGFAMEFDNKPKK